MLLYHSILYHTDPFHRNMAPKDKRSSKKPGSFFHKGRPTVWKKRSNGKYRLRLEAYGFGCAIPLEAYIYEKGQGNNGFLQFYRKHVSNEKRNEMLQDAGFIALLDQRQSREVDQAAPLPEKPEFHRAIMVRFLETESTAQTRREGLAILREFFMDRAHTQFPPSDIPCVDNTEDPPLAMDHFFLSEDIMNLLEQLVPEAERNEQFFSNHTELAKQFFSSPHPPQEAVEKYGYPFEHVTNAPPPAIHAVSPDSKPAAK